MTRWVYRISDNAWMVRGFGDPALIHAQPGNYAYAECPGDDCPDPRSQRHDATSPTTCRAATAGEQAAYDHEIADAAAARAYRDRDRLALFAVMAEAYNSGWPAMTNAQRRDEVVRLAKRWEQHRKWITRNYESMAW